MAGPALAVETAPASVTKASPTATIRRANLASKESDSR
jgi:hypothetical protein